MTDVETMIIALKLQSRTKWLGQRASSPLSPLTMLIIGWFFFSFCWKKRYIFQHWLGGMGDTWSGSSVPTTFGRDCSLDPKTFDLRNKKLENDSRLLPKEIWRLELSIKMQLWHEIYRQFSLFYLTIGSCFSVHHRVMYQSNWSFNIPPGSPGAFVFFGKFLFKFPPPEAEKLFKCPIIGSFQVIKCPHPRETFR